MTAVQEEEDVRKVRFYGVNEPSDTITVDDIDRICEEPELGEIGFQFFRQFRGNAVIDGKIENISSNNKFLCCFDDGDIRTYPRKAIKTMTATNFPELRNMSEIDIRKSADTKDSEAELWKSDSEEETLEILSKNKGERANERS